jgi:hypothetical protein
MEEEAIPIEIPMVEETIAIETPVTETIPIEVPVEGTVPVKVPVEGAILSQGLASKGPGVKALTHVGTRGV